MAGKFEIKTSAGGQFMFNLKAGNGEVILTSQHYENKTNCENGIASVKANALDDGQFDRKDAKDGQFYFNLTATNGQVIGKSEMYKAIASRDNGIESVKKNAPEAPIVEVASA